jgi:two-component system, cell cycle sensor histidine kinase and response regulator CckA
VRRVLDAAQRAAGITSQLLALGRRQLQRREPIDLSEQCAHTAELLRRLVGEQVRLELDLDRSLPRVTADRSQVEQVLLNLMVNARDAMPQGGVMRIATRRAGARDALRCEGHVEPADFVALLVEDDGTGMDAATQARIFEPFFTTKEGGKGTGLGLAVVYGIVMQSEGHVIVDSEPGRGSRFCVLLPIAGAASLAAAPAVPVAPGAASARPARRTVMVVEDEVAIREVMAAALRRSGHVVIAAGSGEEALAELERCGVPPDLLLTDIMMPGMGGIALAAAAHERHPGIVAAFMSGYSEDLLEGRVGGHDRRAFLAKPFTPAQLVAFVGAQIARAGGRAAAA